MRTWFWILTMWFVCAAAQADEGVLLREQNGLRSHLCGALRIQLTGTTDVQCEPEQGELPLAERIEATAARVRERGARLGVLLERDPSPGRVRMYIVSSVSDRAVIAIESIEDRPQPDVDRSLALKVLDAYQVLAVARAALPQSGLPVAASLTPIPAAPTELWLLFLDAGGGVTLGAHTRGLAAFSLGIARLRATTRLELGAGVRLGSRVQVEASTGQVSVHERGGMLTARLLFRRRSFELGGALDGLLSVFAAEGIASDGSRASDKQLVPAISLALDLRYRLFASAFVRFAPALELSLVRQSWAVDRDLVLEQGLARINLPLSLVVSLPLSQKPDELQP